MAGLIDKRARAINKRNHNYYNFENRNLLQYSVSEREIKEHQDKISNIVKQNDTTYGIINHKALPNSGLHHNNQVRVMKMVESPDLINKQKQMKNYEFQTEIYQKEILSLIKN